jgi:hypothetical protein
VYASLGYSSVSLPLDVTSSGAVIGVGALVTIGIQERGFFVIDLGYDHGFQSVATSDGGDIEASTRMFHLGAGIGSTF